jgi:hypothetical protein
MAGRILSMQRQARELGRLRTGYHDGKRPVKSTTWIVTSHAEHYLDTAAATWGGRVEKWQPQGGGAAQYRAITEVSALDAILPPGDPLSQAYEMWSGGGCARRCDGITETLSDGPCICRARFGEDFHVEAKGTVCSATTRLNVFLPDMPDVGVWRVETHSYYAAQEIAGAVDLIRSAVGPDAVIPIRLRIEQRQRKAGGQTKKFPVVVVELRGITTGQVLGASVMGGQELAAQAQREAITSGRPTAAAAIEAAPAPAPEPAVAQAEPVLDVDSVRASIAAVPDIESLREIWPQAKAAGLEDVAKARAAEFAAQPAPAPAPQPAAATSDDPDELWAQIVRAVPQDWTSTQVESEFTNYAQVPPDQASAADMRAYLDHLRTQN